MSHLPPDPAQWPANPYKLLGVPLDADKKAIRQAYAKLAREYKPDDHPAAFARLREAYDRVLYQLNFQAAEPHGSAPLAAAHEGREPFADVPDPEAELEAAWKPVESGDPQTGHARLEELARRHPALSALTTRRYWLRTVYPILDPEPPADRLLAALSAAADPFPVLELLHDAYRLRPEAAASPAANDALNARMPPHVKVLWARARWGALYRLERFDQIAADLEALGASFDLDQDRFLAQANLNALDFLAWSSTWPHFEIMAKTCNDRFQADPAAQEGLERLDYLVAMRADWFAIRRTPGRNPWKQVVPWAWLYGFEDVEEGLWPVLAEIAKEPVNACRRMDQVFAKRSVALAQVLNLFQHGWFQHGLFAAHPEQFSRDTASSAPAIRRHLRASGFHYSSSRTAHLRFSLCYGLDPAQIAAFVENDAELRGRNTVEWAAEARADLVLRIAYYACRCMNG